MCNSTGNGRVMETETTKQPKDSSCSSGKVPQPSSRSKPNRRITTLYLSAASLIVLQLMLLATCKFGGDEDVSLFNTRYIASTQSENNPILKLVVPPSNPAFQPNVKIHSSKKLFQDMPVGNRKTFYSHSSKVCHVMIRALRQLGWTRVNTREDAQLIWTYTRMKSWYPNLEPWQRYNHIPRTFAWNHKDKFAQGFRRYQKRTNADLYFLPQTYNLNDKNEMKEFKERLLSQGGLDQPWVLKGMSTSVADWLIGQHRMRYLQNCLIL